MDNKRPEVAIGHVVMHVSDVGTITDFYLKLGVIVKSGVWRLIQAAA